jgi:hypothetical protein
MARCHRGGKAAHDTRLALWIRMRYGCHLTHYHRACALSPLCHYPTSPVPLCAALPAMGEEKRKGRGSELWEGRRRRSSWEKRKGNIPHGQGVQIRLEKTKIHWNEILGLGDVIGDEPTKARLPLPVKSDAPILMCL